MNNLQQVSENENYFVSVKDPGLVDPERIIKTFDYTHPVFNRKAIDAQKDLPSLNNLGPIYFCGSYFRYGFHEDALTSAITVAEKILGKAVWA